jgi:hypothetical protein
VRRGDPCAEQVAEFAEDNAVPMIRFAKGERKLDGTR